MNRFETSVELKLNSYIKNHNKSICEYKFIIAISGGIDSMALLNCLHELRLSFYTVHFNHNYHHQSKKIARFLYNLSQHYHLKKHFNIELDLSGAKNFESEARIKRYKHLKNLRRRLDCDFILTAHHLDDQIETLHMKRIQNTHWSNSLGIREKIDFIRRPLLSISKKQIINYAKEKKIFWKEDPTNSDNSFMRNRVRNLELPKIVSLKPQYPSKLLSQQIIDRDRFDKIVDEINDTNFLINEYRFGISINANQFLKFSKVGKRLIIQQFIDKKFNVTPVQCSYSNWENLFIYLKSNIKRSTLFPLSKQISIYRSRSAIYIVDNTALRVDAININNRCNWFDGIFTFAETQIFKKYLDKSMAILPKDIDCKVRQWRPSDTYVSATSGHKRKVSDLFIDKKMNYIQKRIQPIVVDGNDTIVWIPGLAHVSIKSNSKYRKYLWESTKC